MKAPLNDRHHLVPIDHKYFYEKLPEHAQKELEKALAEAGFQMDAVRQVWIDEDRMYVTIYHHDSEGKVHLETNCFDEARARYGSPRDACTQEAEVIFE